VSGVVGVHIQAHHFATKRSYELVLLWTKPERKKEIQWAGVCFQLYKFKDEVFRKHLDTR
jgi:hypothetical protein